MRWEVGGPVWCRPLRSHNYYLRPTLILKKWNNLIVYSVIVGILTGIVIDILGKPLIVYNVQASTEVEKKEPREVRLEVVVNWTPERIEKEIRDVFPETPNTAVAIAKAEGGLVKERQSDHYKDGVREPSFCAFQIHEPSWGARAKKLGYGDYKTNPASCIKMARYIYDTGSWDEWSAYNNGSYKIHL